MELGRYRCYKQLFAVKYRYNDLSLSVTQCSTHINKFTCMRSPSIVVLVAVFSFILVVVVVRRHSYHILNLLAHVSPLFVADSPNSASGGIVQLWQDSHYPPAR